jgi:hypothetical protein
MADISPLSSQDPPSLKMAWSARSAELARGTSEEMQAARNQDERWAIVDRGLQKIAKDNDTTGDEKALASMALSYSPMLMNRKAISGARSIVLSAFTTAIGGSLGSVIGKISQDSEGTMGQTSDKNNLLYYNLMALNQQPGANGDEKKLASLGLGYSNQLMNTDAIVAARGCIMGALAASCISPIGHALADVMLKADSSIKSGGDKNYSYYYGLKMLDDEVPGTAPEKALTTLGLAYSNQLMNSQAILEARKSIAVKLAAPFVDTPERTIIAASLDAFSRIREKGDRNYLLYYALNAVQKMVPDGTPEKALTNLGLSYSNQLMSTGAILEARKSIADILSAPRSESALKLICNATKDAIGRMTESSEKNYCLYYAFNAVSDLPGASAEQKSIAQKAAGLSTMNNSTAEMLKKRRELMEDLLSAKDPIDEIKEMVANLAKPAEAQAIVKDDDEEFISIDGVKLEVRNESLS